MQYLSRSREILWQDTTQGVIRKRGQRGKTKPTRTKQQRNNPSPPHATIHTCGYYTDSEMKILMSRHASHGCACAVFQRGRQTNCKDVCERL